MPNFAFPAPRQDSANENSGTMFLYSVYEPSPRLKPFVQNFSIVENSMPLEHSILPRAALMLGVRFAGNMSLSTADNLVADTFSSGVLGLQDSYRLFRKEANTGMLAINFTETGAGAFLKMPLNELFNGGFTLDSLIGRSLAAQLEELVGTARTAEGRVQAAEAFLLSMLRSPEPDNLVLASLQAIRTSGGTLRTDDLAARLFISSSRFEKRFRALVGTSPKKFASMVRVASVIRGFKTGRSFTDLALDAGYFDQAHFSRDFRNFTGLSPRELLLDRQVVSGNRHQPCGFIYGSELAPVLADSI